MSSSDQLTLKLSSPLWQRALGLIMYKFPLLPLALFPLSLCVPPGIECSHLRTQQQTGDHLQDKSRYPHHFQCSPTTFRRFTHLARSKSSVAQRRKSPGQYSTTENCLAAMIERINTGEAYFSTPLRSLTGTSPIHLLSPRRSIQPEICHYSLHKIMGV